MDGGRGGRGEFSFFDFDIGFSVAFFFVNFEHIGGSWYSATRGKFHCGEAFFLLLTFQPLFRIGDCVE